MLESVARGMAFILSFCNVIDRCLELEIGLGVYISLKIELINIDSLDRIVSFHFNVDG